MLKKVMFFHHSATIGGAGISGLYILNALKKEGHDIVVYCKSARGEMANIYEENGYKVIKANNSPVPFRHCVGSELFMLSPGFIKNIIEIQKDKVNIRVAISEINPDIIIVNSMTLVWIGKIAKEFKIETICFFRETFIHGMIGLRTYIIKKYLSKYFDKISFISNYELERCKDIKSYKKTIYNMIECENYDNCDKEETRKELGFKETDFLVLYIGGFSLLKGAHVILRAFNQIKNKNIKLVFIGREIRLKKKRWKDCRSFKERTKHILNLDFRERCIHYILKNNLHEKIIFSPNVKNIGPFYKACDVLVFPMAKPHQARPLFEAGYAKIPVIITNFINIKEFADESNCYLIKNGADKQLANIINTICDNYSGTYNRVLINYDNTIKRHSREIFERRVINFFKA